MGLSPPVPGLRVLHDTISSEKVEVSIRAGEELIVSPYLAEQLVRQRGSFKVDADELAAGLAAEKAADEAVAAPDEDVEPAPAKKVAAKKTAPKRTS